MPSTPDGKIRVTPTDASLGAYIDCGDLRQAGESAAAAIRKAWLDNLVVVFRDQQLSDADLVAFGSKFGEFQFSRPLASPVAMSGSAKQGGAFDAFPQITVVSNVVENGVALGGLGDGEVVWHTDMSNFEVPPNQTMLYALETPRSGGKTGFCNMYLALEQLPKALRARIDGRKLKHGSLTDAAGYTRQEHAKFASAEVSARPGAVHPIICTHPETHRDCLYLGRRSDAYVMGMEIADSEALLDELWAHMSQEHLFWFHEWKPGDLVMWDNRCTMHRREPFDARARRVLHRVVIKGSAPSYAAAGGTHPRGQAARA